MNGTNGVAEPPPQNAPATEPLLLAIQNLQERLARLEQAQTTTAPRALGRGTMVDLKDAIKQLSKENGGAFEAPSEIAPPTHEQRFHDRSTVIVCPTRGAIDSRVVYAWNALKHAMNQRRIGPLFARGYEVGHAYDELISGVLEHPQLKTWKYVLTLEDDNLPPPDAHLALLEAMERHPEFDAIAGLYHTKDAAQLPMAYGDPAHFKETGRTVHFPIDRKFLDPRNPEPVEVLGIPMGCTIWRMDLFREVAPTWFMTLSDKVLLNGKLVPFEQLTDDQTKDAKKHMTQDLTFCEVAVKQHGKRFAVLPSLRVGHLDPATGVVY